MSENYIVINGKRAELTKEQMKQLEIIILFMMIFVIIPTTIFVQKKKPKLMLVFLKPRCY